MEFSNLGLEVGVGVFQPGVGVFQPGVGGWKHHYFEGAGVFQPGVGVFQPGVGGSKYLCTWGGHFGVPEKMYFGM